MRHIEAFLPPKLLYWTSDGSTNILLYLSEFETKFEYTLDKKKQDLVRLFGEKGERLKSRDIVSLRVMKFQVIFCVRLWLQRSDSQFNSSQVILRSYSYFRI
jgi:hypothetical protein